MTTENEINALHRELAVERLRADQGWARYEIANASRKITEENLLNANEQIAKLIVNALKGPFPKGETTIAKNSVYTALYNDFLKNKN